MFNMYSIMFMLQEHFGMYILGSFVPFVHCSVSSMRCSGHSERKNAAINLLHFPNEVAMQKMESILGGIRLTCIHIRSTGVNRDRISKASRLHTTNMCMQRIQRHKLFCLFVWLQIRDIKQWIYRGPYNKSISYNTQHLIDRAI